MPFKAGDIVTVYNQKFSGEPIIEGRARIIKPTGVGDQYKVRFVGEAAECMGTFDRFIYPGRCQDDPQGYIADAKAEWADRARPSGSRQDEKPDVLVRAVEADMARLGL